MPVKELMEPIHRSPCSVPSSRHPSPVIIPRMPAEQWLAIACRNGHRSVGGPMNEVLERCTEACDSCREACRQCAEACRSMPDMQKCVQLCDECANACDECINVMA